MEMPPRCKGNSVCWSRIEEYEAVQGEGALFSSPLNTKETAEAASMVAVNHNTAFPVTWPLVQF